MAEVSLPMPRGKTFYNGTTIDSNDLAGVHLEGLTVEFIYHAPGAPKTNLNAVVNRAILVRNTSTIALSAGREVVWAAGYRHQRVGGYSASTATEIAGVVDDHLTGTVPVNDLFWLMQSGPVLIKTPLAAGDFPESWTEGQLLYALTAAASTSATAGRATAWGGTFSATQTTDGTAGRIIRNGFGRVMSARTSGQADTNTLVDLMIR